MSFLSSLAAPVLSLAGGLFGQSQAQSHADSAAAQQFERQQELMRLQHNFQVEDYKHRYQWSAQDMRAAGLNPILAATQGIGGSIAGVSAGAAAQAQTPTQDFGRLGEVFNSTRSISSQKEIARMQNDLGLGELKLKELDINSAIEKRKNDMIIAQGRLDLDRWTARESMRLKEVMQDAQIKNMVERLQADIEHMQRMDANGAVAASAAMAHANAAGLMAAVQDKLGMKREEMMQAQEAYLGLQSENAEESLKWQKWLNDHPYTRGAVGLIGSILDTAGLASAVAKPGTALFNNALSGSDDVVAHVPDYESWIR